MDLFVSPMVASLIDKAKTYGSREIALVWGVKGELKKLARTLELIQAVLDDAENRQVESNQLVKRWLGELKDVADEGEDVLDELHYEDLDYVDESSGFRLLLSKLIGFCGFCGLSGFCNKNKIAHQIEDLNKKLDHITQDMEKFKFSTHSGGSRSNENRSEETTSQISDSAAVVGREKDVSNILDLLSDCGPKSYSVVRIHGMGGIGKTTLAQLVWKELDDNIYKDRFKLKLWASVSRKSDFKEIFKDHVDRQSSLKAAKDCLEEKLKAGKCLIVLDDVWIKNDNGGIDVDELLKVLLSMSCEGSKILMTMRSKEAISPKTDARYTDYRLKGLPRDDCWSMIKKTAFAHGGAKETADLINIGKKIASKCEGLPIAAKTLGCLLYSRESEEEWESILNSPILNLGKDEKILSLLKLSYDDLLPDVKRCFSYCSIFPKGYVFLKKELIRMWMAEGFLNSPSDNGSPETVGNEYFKILLLNSFFQDECRNKCGDIKSCRMHDLVHDLAISTAGSESRMVNITTDAVPEVKQSNKIRRLRLQVLDYGVSAVPSEIFEAFKKLHTFVSFGFNCGQHVWVDQIFSLRLLRVLNLSGTGLEELPQSISKVKLLRYLDVSYTGITTFPSSFGKLYKLQTLRLKGCKLKELPKDMRDMIGLEYLILDNEYEFTQMPREVSRLSKLKKLPVFIVGEGKGYGIEELKDLNLLGGKLIIKNLGSVTDGKKANLKGKKCITHLQLRWDSQSCNDPDITKDAEVINDLQPHRKLKQLGIFNFCGSRFPTWMTSTSTHLPNLERITLKNCGNCERLPAFGALQSLRYLHMEGFGGVKHIGDEFYRSNEEASNNEEARFPSLVELHMIDFSNLEEWLADDQSSSSFSCLEELEIRSCSKLSITPTEFPSLSLKNSDFSIELLMDANLKSLHLNVLRGHNVLRNLVVSRCNAFVGFLPDNDDHLSNDHLSRIDIYSCPSLKKLPDFRGLNTLTHLALQECSSIQSLPDGIQNLPKLETLRIGGFSEDLVSFPFPAATGSDGEQYFVSLRELKISGWPTLRVTVLPDQLRLLTSLQFLTVRGFPCLSSLPEWFGEFSSLRTLSIEHCKELKYLPSKEQMVRLTYLETLNIGNSNSPLLFKRCGSRGEEWHKIAHLKVNRSSPSLLDHITRNADMNEELEARRRSGTFSNQYKEKCWTDSSRRNCFMLFPKSFNICWEHETRYWRWLSITEPAASDDAEIEVPELVDVCWLDVHGKLDISKLSPGVNYEVVFVVMFRKDSYGWHKPVDLCLELPGGQRQVQKVILKTMPKSEWIEIRVGDFKTPQQPGEINFWLFEHVSHWKKGLVIEGAIIRPKK